MPTRMSLKKNLMSRLFDRRFGRVGLLAAAATTKIAFRLHWQRPKNKCRKRMLPWGLHGRRRRRLQKRLWRLQQRYCCDGGCRGGQN